MYGIQTSNSMSPMRPQAPEVRTDAPRPDAAGAAGTARVVAQGPSVPALDAARTKADELSRAAQDVRRGVERQVSHEIKLAEQRSPSSGAQAPSAESVRARREALAGELDDARNSLTVSARLLDGNLRGIAQSDYAMSAEQKQDLGAALEDAFADAEPQARAIGAPMLYSAKAPTGEDMSDSKLWKEIADAIGGIKDNYLGIYENVVGQYTDFYKAFSDKVLAKIGKWIESGGDGNKVKLNVGELKKALEDLIKDFSLPNKAAVLFPTQAKGDGAIEGGDKAAAEKWADEMGLPRSCVQQTGGKWVVVIDTTPITTMKDNVPAPGTGVVEMDNAKFQSWQSGFKAQEENLKNTLQTLTQKYSNANSLFDNLVKVLSSTISSCLETAKSFLQI
ncbi:type III secretion system needle tip protein SctA [Chromobacterium sp. CV08]|uniref:type III secretion system needle tip protein SctA n=1 Tax=Chromobacterium sp. CV08 TaxID=3133274 RepID=UPI003DA88EA0